LIHHLTAKAASGQTTTCGGKDGSGFLFIHDLTNSPHGVEMIILLILYIGTSIGSSLIMMMPGTEKNQKRLMLGLPVVFALITIRFPAGALLYYIVFNLWMVIQQSVFKELIGKQYRHPAGEAIGIDGEEGSVSSGGGLAGLFGLKQGSEDVDEPSRPSDKKTPGSGAGRRRGGSTATAEPKAKPSTPKTKPKSGSSHGSNGSNGKSSNGNGNGASDSEKGTNSSRSGPPPSSPRKRKKRSGRRR
jgi:YidC/Oxa1 family membrane protein insertase